MECLRGKSKRELQDLNTDAPFPGRDDPPKFYWTPCVDGDILEETPSELYANNKFLSVPSLFGTTTNGKLLHTQPPRLTKTHGLTRRF